MGRFLLLAGIVVGLSAAAFGGRSLDRGFVAVPREDGGVFLSWRLLEADGEDASFRVKRVQDGTARMLTPEAIRQTNVLDDAAQAGREYTYLLYGTDDTTAPIASARIRSDEPAGYISVPLDGDYDFKAVGVGDLDGDGSLEFIIKQPDFNTDPYQQPGYWKKSPTTYKLEAYRQDGAMLWRYDMGWAIEAGMWYSPWVVYDIDGDGRDEVYTKAGEGDPRDEKGLVTSGPEWLVKLDPATGRIVKKADWLPRDGYQDYNRYQRNFLAVGYLDGKKPSLVMQRGTYNLIRQRAYDRDLNITWTWQSTDEQKRYNGQSSHNFQCADVDGDGRDEVVVGACVVDENGKGLWTLEMGHPDICHVADIQPGRPGLEIFYGFETRQNTDGLCVVDAATGEKLWTHKEPTRHVHGQGFAADTLGEQPGMECFAGERDVKIRWLYSADGKLIRTSETGALSPRPLWWDGDGLKELAVDRAVRRPDGEVMRRLEGDVVAVLDCLGDWREEVICSREGEMRIYTTTTPTTIRRPCLLQNRLYRLGVAAQTSGYYYPPQLGLE